MQHFAYRTGKNIVMGLFMALLAIVSTFSWMRDGGFWSATGALLFAGGAFVGLKLAMSSEPALSFDARTIVVRSTFKTIRLKWSQVLDISVRTIRIRYWGLIPISKQDLLNVQYDRSGGGSGKVHLSLGTVKLPPGGTQLLLAKLNGAWIAAVGETGVAMAGAGKQGWGAERRAAKVAAIDADAAQTSDFDPDAALARYLAAKEAGLVASVATPDAVQIPTAPLRPSFGRKVA